MKRMLRLIKRHPALYQFLRYGVYGRFRSARREQVFVKVYDQNYWQQDFSVSGPGSSLEATEDLRRALPQLVETLDARSFLDIPCGDFQWMKHVSLGVEKYIGADIVHPLVRKNRNEFGEHGDFLHLDLLKDSLPSVDIIFCRDCLVHLSFQDIRLALNNVRSAAPEYFLTTTFPDHEENRDTVLPYWRRLNLERHPFGFPAPVHLVKDFSARQTNDRGKYLGAWRTQDITKLV